LRRRPPWSRHAFFILLPTRSDLQETFHYPGEKMAKVIGIAAQQAPEEGARVSGLLVAKTFNYLILSPDEIHSASHSGRLGVEPQQHVPTSRAPLLFFLAEFTDYKVSKVRQRQLLRFEYDLSFLRNLLTQIHGASAIKELETAAGPALLVRCEGGGLGAFFDRLSLFANASCPFSQMMDRIAMSHDAPDRTLILEWDGSPENDMWADAIVMMVLELEGSPQAIRSKKASHCFLGGVLRASVSHSCCCSVLSIFRSVASTQLRNEGEAVQAEAMARVYVQGRGVTRRWSWAKKHCFGG
jgi:cleavage and polyadenylation specificity factor subunit 3